MSETRVDAAGEVEKPLYMALELGDGKWKLGFTTGLGQPPRERDIAGGDCASLEREIQQAKERFNLPEDALVVSCYEAGRNGFWLHRYLTSGGVRNVVVDSSSIQVDRRKRRAKTDRLDVKKLLRMLIRWHLGEKDVWKVVNVPSPQDEDARQLHRELQTLREEQARHMNRIKGLLASCGASVTIDRRLPKRLSALRLWDGSPLPKDLQKRLLREFQRMQLLNRQIRHLEKERAQQIRQTQDDRMSQVRKLLCLKGIGPNSAWLYVQEVFGWRKIRNRRQLAALVGLVPVPFNSARRNENQGISKAGNRRMRVMAIEIAWCWLRFQPGSALSRWFERRFAHGSKRQRRIGIVALARKLLIALWKYILTGVPPEGAEIIKWKGRIVYTGSLV